MKVKEIVQQQSELIIDTHTTYKAIVSIELEKLLMRISLCTWFLWGGFFLSIFDCF
jgi:hypothetical protein